MRIVNKRIKNKIKKTNDTQTNEDNDNYLVPVDPVYGDVGSVRVHRGAERVRHRSAAVHQRQEEQDELLHYATGDSW